MNNYHCDGSSMIRLTLSLPRVTLDLILSNARRFNSSKGDLLGFKGLKNLIWWWFDYFGAGTTATTMMTMINRIITTNIPGKQNSTSFNSILFPKVFKTQLCNNPVRLKECQITAGIHTRLSIRFVAGVCPVAIEAVILKSFVGQYDLVVGDSALRLARFCWKPCLHLFFFTKGNILWGITIIKQTSPFSISDIQL